jgi:hypothetical protein
MTAGEAPRLVSVPRPDGGTRTLTVLSGDDERRYRLAVARVARRIERALGPEAMANRANGLRREPWRPARAAFVEARRRLGAHAQVLVVTDVRDCYASIDAAVVAADLAALGAGADEIDDIETILRRFEGSGVRGLPVGPEPSAILANGVLARVDAVLREQGLAHMRWVDDVTIAAPDRRRALTALEAFRRSLAARGLEANEAKTILLTDRDEISAIVSGPQRLSRLGALPVPSSTRHEDALPSTHRPHPDLPGDG